MSVALARPRPRPGLVSWSVPGDAFVARRLREVIAPDALAGCRWNVPGASVAIAATARGLSHVVLSADGDAPLPEGAHEEPGLRDLAQLVARRLLRWAPEADQLPLDVSGTPFQIETWTALRAVRVGTTVTYGELAMRIGRPGAARAVGGAVSANPVPVLVPCHRVLAAGGAIGGFACGLPLKRRLLVVEGWLG